ncbi:hypothetical protein L2E82_00806 [Cichorium intybus]|uniref:Uncharacterized protein n=1 Tax=Cichorium intybus TaxID=13427 RepID=A0ACB9GYF8_CICIN|nr:hypothetical protein L2E82_00806 [Cichorium intybus]
MIVLVYKTSTGFLLKRPNVQIDGQSNHITTIENYVKSKACEENKNVDEPPQVLVIDYMKRLLKEMKDTKEEIYKILNEQMGNAFQII